MTMPIAPGTYRIRNLGTGQYIAPVGGYSSPGRTIALEPYSQEATHKVSLQHGAHVGIIAGSIIPVSGTLPRKRCLRRGELRGQLPAAAWHPAQPPHPAGAGSQHTGLIYLEVWGDTKRTGRFVRPSVFSCV